MPVPRNEVHLVLQFVETIEMDLEYPGPTIASSKSIWTFRKSIWGVNLDQTSDDCFEGPNQRQISLTNLLVHSWSGASRPLKARLSQSNKRVNNCRKSTSGPEGRSPKEG